MRILSPLDRRFFDNGLVVLQRPKRGDHSDCKRKHAAEISWRTNCPFAIGYEVALSVERKVDAK